jgi:hypothetical protein
MTIKDIIQIFEDSKARADFTTEQIKNKGITTFSQVGEHAYHKGLAAGYELAANTLRQATQIEVEND